MTRAKGVSVWRVVLLLSAGGLLASAVAVWFFFPTQYEAFVLVKIAAAQPSIFPEKPLDPEEFERFKSTQAEMVTTGAVLNAVLRDASVHRLASLQGHDYEMVEWLGSRVTTTFPGDAEVMRVAVSLDSPGDAVKVADKILDSYLSEIVYFQKSQRMADEAKLRQAYEQQLADYRRELESLAALEQQYKTSGSEAAQLKKKLALEELNGLIAERQHIREAIRDNDLAIVLDKARSELEEQKPTADSVSLSLSRQQDESLPLALLEKRREFLKRELSQVDTRIAEMTKMVSGLESFSALVAAKQEELDTMRLQKQELGEMISRLRLNRLAPDRISLLDKAQLAGPESQLWRNVLIGSLAGLGVLAGALGLIVGRPKELSVAAASV